MGSETEPRVFVFDPIGRVFVLVREADLGISIVRWREIDEEELGPDGVVLFATYGEVDWVLLADVVARSRTVLVAIDPAPDDAVRALSMGAFGHLTTTLPADAFRRAVLGAIAGEPAFARRVVAEWIQRTRGTQVAPRALPLTPRQREVVTLIATGAADKEIARRLGIATGTAQKHVTNALRRLDVPNRAAAAALVASIAGIR